MRHFLPSRAWPSLLLWSLVVVCAAGAGSCSDRGSPYEPPGSDLPRTPNQLVLQLRNAYYRVDATAVERLLHEDFTFTYQTVDADSMGLPDRWDRVREMEFTRNMFAGEAGRRVDGSRQPPLDLINAFSGQVTPAAGSVWTPVEDGPFAGSLRRTFYANWFCQYEELDTDFVLGFNEFYVVEETIPGRYGEPISVVRLLAWHDQGVGVVDAAKHQTISWARLKGKFQDRFLPARSDPPRP